MPPTRARQHLAVVDLLLEVLEPIIAVLVFIDPVSKASFARALLVGANAIAVTDAAAAGNRAVGPPAGCSGLHVYAEVLSYIPL